MNCLKIEFPERILCAFLNYVCVDEDGSVSMCVREIATKDIKAGHVIVEAKEEA